VNYKRDTAPINSLEYCSIQLQNFYSLVFLLDDEYTHTHTHTQTHGKCHIYLCDLSRRAI